MKSDKRGKSTSKVEILGVTPNGVWLLAINQEFFLTYKEFPWFKNATINEIMNCKLVHSRHIYWPKLDVDLSLESLKSPEKFPLVAKGRKKSKRAA